jgi:4-amino-4-deoxy-L-arabinose transferase-like glycosyltransferase
MLLVSAHTARRTIEAGLAVAGLGALLLVWSGAMMLSKTQEIRRRGWATILAGFLLGLGFAVQILGFYLSGKARS